MRFTMVKIVYQIRVFTLHVHVINFVIVYDNCGDIVRT